MPSVRASGDRIREFLISNLEDHPRDIVPLAMRKFGCSRQAVHKHLHNLRLEGSIIVEGKTRQANYKLAPISEWWKPFTLSEIPSESEYWNQIILPALLPLPPNIVHIWHYGFTEMFNNVIDHSGCNAGMIRFSKTAASTQIQVLDTGVGIFKKIQSALGLIDERHAVLELAKGKFTTNPEHHTGEGIFFSSRMFDHFVIWSGNVYYTHDREDPRDWILPVESSTPGPIAGTLVTMILSNNSSRTTKQVFDRFSSSEDYGFSKTTVPVRLVQLGDDNLVSRSQAKRLLERLDRFHTVILDFASVETIGQAFADEVFRVFVNAHPNIVIVPVHFNLEVRKMIHRAQGKQQ